MGLFAQPLELGGSAEAALLSLRSNDEFTRTFAEDTGDIRFSTEGCSEVDHAIQIARSCAVIPLRIWTDRPTLPTATPPALRPRVSPSHGPQIPDLVGDHRHSNGRIQAK